MPSNLFERLVADGEALLQQMKAVRTPETVDLEFKRKARPENGDFERGDKQALGQTLSAFANSAGGVLIFGVKAAKVDGVDCVQDLEPIANIASFASTARQLVGSYLLPRHEGVRVQEIARVGQPGFG